MRGVSHVKSTINPKLMKILACPVCKAGLRLKKDWLVCTKCGRRYPIKDGVPYLLPDELRGVPP